MLELILTPAAFLGTLIAGAVLTPMLALAGWKTRPEFRRRWLIAAGAAGPVIIAMWGLHNLVLEFVGFASVWSLLIVVSGGVLLGAGAGLWIRRDTQS